MKSLRKPLRAFLETLKRLSLLGSKRRVDFLIAGTQKGGSTALHHYLLLHPEVGMANVKGVHFFDNEEYFRRSQPSYSKYHVRFHGVWSRKVLGEATPNYMYCQEAPQRIQQYNPQMKLIVVLRNPIERAYSHWNMSRDKMRDALSFWDALQSEKERLHATLPLQNRVYSYIDRGFYTEQLGRIWKFFPKEQTLLLRSEDLKQRPQAPLDDVCRFLGVPPFARVESKEIYAREYLAPMSGRERDYLRQVFTPEIRQLEQLLGWNCSDWLKD